MPGFGDRRQHTDRLLGRLRGDGLPVVSRRDHHDHAGSTELVDPLAQRGQARGVVRRVPVGPEAEVDAVDPQVLAAGVDLTQDVLDRPDDRCRGRHRCARDLPEHLEADQFALLRHASERPDVGAPDEPAVDRLHRVGHDGCAALGTAPAMMPAT
jgi:hypothetical protein